MKYGKMTTENCNMLNIWNFKLKKSQKKNAKSITKKENANTDETKLSDTKTFQTEVIWNCQDHEIWITRLGGNKLNFKRDLIWKIYCYCSIAIQRNTLVGFLYKVFINSVFIGW